MRVSLTTLGCKANWADTEAVSQRLKAAGIEVVRPGDEADICVVNTCTVTALASAQSRQMLSRMRRRSPRAVIVAAGCLGELASVELKRLPGVSAVFGARDRRELVDFIMERAQAAPQPANDDSNFGMIAGSAQSRARAFLKIQDGCDRTCAYCIIRRARGPSRSLPMADVLSAARTLSGHHREIVLTGIDIGQYGSDLCGGESLPGLLAFMSDDPAISRVRTGTLSPSVIDDALAGIFAGKGLCRHVHMSVQSGSDSILASMRRGYSSDAIERAVSMLAAKVPKIAITADVIAGLPGESESDHKATMRLVERLPFAGLHVFPYSARPGTEAAEMPGQVPAGERRRRAAELREIAEKKRAAYLKGLIGESLDVIVISRRPDSDGTVRAFSDNAVEISLPAFSARYGRLRGVVVTSVEGLDVSGEWR